MGCYSLPPLNPQFRLPWIQLTCYTRLHINAWSKCYYVLLLFWCLFFKKNVLEKHVKSYFRQVSISISNSEVLSLYFLPPFVALSLQGYFDRIIQRMAQMVHHWYWWDSWWFFKYIFTSTLKLLHICIRQKS